MRKALLALGIGAACCLASFVRASVEQEHEGLSAEEAARIERAISGVMSRLHIPGLSVAVTRGNRIAWQRGFGMADLENFVPAKETTVYRIASVSKPITAAAVMQLVEKGKIDLEEILSPQ